MAEFVFSNASVIINSVDLSDHVRSVTLDYQAELQDKTAMGDGTREKIAGLKDWTVTVELNQDHAASNVDATLFPLVGAAAFTVTVKPVNAATSPTNPSYSGSAVLESYPPMGGAVGDLAATTAVFRAAGALTRATA